ncbi:MAG: SET domain-containing protein-lysine N-methyltransferase [Patescibacteria group bacterium]
MIKKVEVKTSKIQGKGVYALADIKKGEVVLIIDDSHVVKDPTKLTNKQNEFDYDYLADGKVILMQSPEKYINHSCDPNTYTKTVNGIRNVIAMRDIKAGEEIIYDYSMNGDNNGTFICHCDSFRCRKIYQGNFFKLPANIQKEYLPYLEDWFIKEHNEEINKLTRTKEVPHIVH